MNGDEIVQPWDRHSNETVILRKNVSKHKNMRKWMVEFLSKFENRGSKIDRVNSILITNFITLQLFTLNLYGVALSCDVGIVKITASAQPLFREDYDNTYK